MFVYQSRFLKRGEVWFDNERQADRVDWILYRNRSTPVPGSKWRYFYNRLIDLSQSEEALMADMDPKTVSKIKTAAQEEKVRWECCDPRDVRIMSELEQMWNESTESKRRWGQLNRDWLGRMIDADALDLTAARDSSGELLIYAVFFRDPRRAQQLMNVSPHRATLDPKLRARTNRASCLLLWHNLLRLKNLGVCHFDFGGWYPGTEDIQLLGANAYKKSFGGEVIREHECEQITSLKGWLLLNAARMLARAKKPRSSQPPTLEANPHAATA